MKSANHFCRAGRNCAAAGEDYHWHVCGYGHAWRHGEENFNNRAAHRCPVSTCPGYSFTHATCEQLRAALVTFDLTSGPLWQVNPFPLTPETETA